MSPFLAAIFLHGLCVANAINFTTVYEWEKVDFSWPSGVGRSIEEIKDEYRPEHVFLQYMAHFGERLFLSVESLPGIPATLVWLPTSGTATASPKLAPFPSWQLHEKDNCNSIQSVKGVETDPDGRLWVLDDGNNRCPGKLWIFNLVNRDSIERVHLFPDTVVSDTYNKRWLHDIVLDKTPDDYLAYITEISYERLIVYSRKMDKSWTVETPGRKWEPSALSANREARQLYLGKYQSNELYSVSVSELQNEGGSASVKLVGEWTARPYRMLIDTGNVLSAAFFNQSYTSKWNISEPFREQPIYEVGGLQAVWPFNFALDANGTLWMTERNGTGSGNRYKLLKAEVGAKSYLYSASTARTQCLRSSIAAILLQGLCVATAVNFNTVYEWDRFDFIWPPGGDTSNEQIKQNFKPNDVELQYVAVFGERLFLNLKEQINNFSEKFKNIKKHFFNSNKQFYCRSAEQQLKTQQL